MKAYDPTYTAQVLEAMVESQLYVGQIVVARTEEVRRKRENANLKDIIRVNRDRLWLLIGKCRLLKREIEAVLCASYIGNH